MRYKHLFFDMDKTVAPSREPILPEMYDLLDSLEQDLVIVSGQLTEKISWQSNNLPAYRMGNNGNHAVEHDGSPIWKNPDLSDAEESEIMRHIDAMSASLPHELNHDWDPIEHRGSQITFSPIGNTAPIEKKRTYDPDRKKREALLQNFPFESETLMLKIGGSTSFDYFRKDGHKGVNVARKIELRGWNKNECVYFGDGLYPGGNDELVIGVIDTIPVTDHLDTYQKLREMLDSA